MLALLELSSEENPDKFVLIKNHGDTFHPLKNQDDVAFWQAFVAMHPLMYDDMYTWTKALATL
jgi:hypothetical protein